MAPNEKLAELSEAGVAVWLDDLSRDRIRSGGADPSLKGKAALANAQLAYQAYEEVFSSGRWRALQAQGAKT